MKKHYATLEVEETATEDEIKKAYRRAARKHHSDRGGDDEKMADVNKAWEVLGDAERRAAYDATGEDNVMPYAEAAKGIVTMKTMQWLQTQDESSDLIAYLVQELENDMRAILANQAKGQAILKKFNGALKRLEYTGNEKDILREAIGLQIHHVQGQLNQVAGDIQKVTLAQAIVRAYKYRCDTYTTTKMVFLGGMPFGNPYQGR